MMTRAALIQEKFSNAVPALVFVAARHRARCNLRQLCCDPEQVAPRARLDTPGVSPPASDCGGHGATSIEHISDLLRNSEVNTRDGWRSSVRRDKSWL
jgi:hypothetical protein